MTIYPSNLQTPVKRRPRWEFDTAPGAAIAVVVALVVGFVAACGDGSSGSPTSATITQSPTTDASPSPDSPSPYVAPTTATVPATKAAPAPKKTTAKPRPAPTTKKPAPRPTTQSAEVYYANCAAVRAAGKAPLYRGQPGYRAGLDRDGDGVACET